MHIRKSSLIILYKKDGKMLFQHRSHDAERNPNNWGCFGGGIEKGETPKEAVLRETFEEIEYRLHNPVLIDKESKNGDKEPFEYVFTEEYDESQPIILHEGQGYGWFTYEETHDLPMSEHRHTALKRLWPLILHHIENGGS